MKIGDFYVSDSDTSGFDLLVSLRELRIKTLPVAIFVPVYRVDCAIRTFSERLSKYYIRLVLKQSREFESKREIDNIKKQGLLRLLVSGSIH